MAVLTWDDGTKKLYESGLDRGVLFVRDELGDYPLGVPWNGLISVAETPGGAEPTDLWANNSKYATLMSGETFGGSIEAYTYPLEFGVCDGSEEPTVGVSVGQQGRAVFGLAYRTRIGSEAGGDVIGHKIHMVWGCRATPSEKSLNTINESPDAVTFSWEFTTTPAYVSDTLQPTSLIVVDTTTAPAAFVEWLEEMLFGTELADPELPLPDEVLTQAALP
jgi:hypothetical protein